MLVEMTRHGQVLGNPSCFAWHVDFSKFGGKGACFRDIVVDISGVRQGVSELLQTVYTLYKSHMYLLRFCH